MITKGLDVSAIQGKVPWRQLKQMGYEFGFAKCREGNKLTDGAFQSNLTAMKDAGIIPGAYHFPFPLPHLDPAEQAEMFFAASDCGSNIGELPPMFDFEWPAPEEWAKWKCTGPQIAAWGKACLERMTELFHCKPIVYIYPYFAQMLLKSGADLSYLGEYPLCMAEYSRAGAEIPETAKPKIPTVWADWTFWQHDGNGGLRLPNGVDSDFMVFNGSLDDLLALARGNVVPEEFSLPNGVNHTVPEE